MDNMRNMILAIVLSALVLFGWSMVSERYFPAPKPAPTATATAAAGQPPATADATPAAAAPQALRNRKLVLAEGPRIRIDTPNLAGSINLKGARIDDLVLKRHRQTLDKDSPPVRLLSPAGAAHAYFASFGWTGENVALPGPDTVWTADADAMVPGKPLNLRWDNGAGQTFTIQLTVDADYMFTVRQTVANAGAGTIAARPYSLIARYGESPDPHDKSSWTIHTGPVGFWAGKDHFNIDYKNLDEDGAQGTRFQIDKGWLGFGDKYWLTALIPDQNATVDAALFARTPGEYNAVFNPAQPTLLAPGQALTTGSKFFAGAKDVHLLERYEKEGAYQLDLSIDWGWFYWFELPIFYLLDWLFKLCGNFGVAILGLTVIVRGLMFPIAQKQFASMAAMRAVQPKMKALQERYKDDKPKLQQEMMALYKAEKVNPLAGCLPTFLQIPVFYALYKVLMLTIEMRHQPFALWIKDLSAPDPLTPVNLFGLLPFTPPPSLGIGVLAILLGVTMWLQFRLNPTPMDDVQKKVFGFMPWILMFVMAPFAAGLQLYWVMSNTLTILQQKWLYSRHPALLAAEGKK
ncbi:membrane protein insertase YidC [Sphingomonas flavalba]|uniref:membrane protein insertase YidC n=1 Tax=Sphingomonas flavalba TaxID=2559804 RepID=UPI00109DB47D|nr:membrane protein insertase YidC [Sphingomonas flavalba]